jgi:hypothetical protein
VRIRSWPYAPIPAILLGCIATLAAVFAILSDADAITGALGALAAGLVLRTIYECGVATVAIRRALVVPAPVQDAAAPTVLAPKIELLPAGENVAPVPLGTLID